MKTVHNLRLCLAVAAFAFGCTKEKVNCGHGFPVASFRFQVVDDRTGLEYFAGPSRPTVDTLKRLNNLRGITVIDNQVVWSGSYFGYTDALPEAGGDVLNTYFIRVSASDTDTVETFTRFGPLVKDQCLPDIHYIRKVEFRYNGRLNDTYEFVPNGKTASFYCGGCGTILMFRKMR